MTRSTFHFRTVEHSPELQRVVDILQSAAQPMSALEVMLRIKEKYEKDALNISTCIGEIRANDEYSVFTIKPKKKGEQYRYALLRSPGWRPTWQEAYLADNSLSVRENNSVCENFNIQEQEELDRPPRICKLDGCFQEIPESGPPFCCMDHREKFFQR